LRGAQTYTQLGQEQRAEAMNQQKINQAADNMMLRAEEARQNLQFRYDTLSESKRQHDLMLNEWKPFTNERGEQMFYRHRSADGSLEISRPEEIGQGRTTTTPTYNIPGEGPITPPVTTKAGLQLDQQEAQAKTAHSLSGDEVLPINARLTTGELTSTSVHPEVLANMDADRAGLVKGIAEGRISAPSLVRQNPFNRKLMADVMAYDPSFATSRMPLRRSFLGGGKDGQTVGSYDMVMQHAGHMMGAIEKLNNFTYFPQEMNIARGIVKSRTSPQYQEALSDANKTADALAGEMMRATRQAGAGTLEEIRHWRAGLNPGTDSPVALRQSVKSILELLDGRMEATGERWNQGMGTNKEALSWLSPKARTAYERMSTMDVQKPYVEITGRQTAPATASAATTGFTGRTATGPNGAKLRETTDGQWVP
jgi:hypothetical protein